MSYLRACVLLAAIFSTASLSAGNLTVSGRVQLAGNVNRKHRDTRTVVVWLSPLDGGAHLQKAADKFPAHPLLKQKDKTFIPHVLVVPVGATVEFPNSDPWFHNVFSLFEGKRFDLGLYEAGSSRRVRFDRPGISYVFCDIHPQMSAVVIALNTPYYDISSKGQLVEISDIPPGRYRLHVWNEAASPETLSSLSREIEISPTNQSLGVIRILQTGDLLLNHRNKYGREYAKPDPTNPIYSEN